MIEGGDLELKGMKIMAGGLFSILFIFFISD